MYNFNQKYPKFLDLLQGDQVVNFINMEYNTSANEARYSEMEMKSAFMLETGHNFNLLLYQKSQRSSRYRSLLHTTLKIYGEVEWQSEKSIHKQHY